MNAPPPNRFLLQNQDPKAKSVITESFTLNFEMLADNVLSAASFLQQNGISEGHFVGIYAPNSVEYLINILALWQLGSVVVPLNVRLSKEELLKQAKYAGCNFILTGKEADFNIKDPTIKTIEFSANQIKTKPAERKTQFDLNNTAAIIFTSGSGKFPKGVELTFNSFYQSGFYSNKLLRYSYSDKLLVSLPLYHIGGFSILTRALLWGVPLIFPKSVAAVDLADSIKNLHPSIISLVAAQLKELINLGIKPNTELKNCLIGGGFTDNDLVKKAIDDGWLINIVYGSTETASFVTALLTEEFNVKRNSVGRPVPPVNILIYDNSRNELKPYEVGEIAVMTPALMKGYIDETGTSNNLPRIFYSGDLGYLDEEGYLYMVGRKNLIISTGGENVNPLEVEAALLQHPQIIEAAVFPLKDSKWGEIVAAVVVTGDESATITYQEIKTFLEKLIPGFKIPKKIFFEKSLPKTELGKIERSKLVNNYKL